MFESCIFLTEPTAETKIKSNIIRLAVNVISERIELLLPMINTASFQIHYSTQLNISKML